MMKSIFHVFFTALVSCILTLPAPAQADTKYTYQAQRKFIPSDLGQVYLGMPLKDLASKIDLSKAESDYRFKFLHIEIPFQKGNIIGLGVRVHGLDREQLDEMHVGEIVSKKNDAGMEYKVEVKRLKVPSIPKDGIVYSMYVTFRRDFDLRAWANKTYGKGEVRAKDDEYHFYDEQWFKRTSDGLGWMIRAFYEDEDRTLQLLGRVPDTEWDPEA
jgi:hypothetical protein